MFSISKENNKYTQSTQEFICDLETDVTQLPTDVAPGSSAFIVETASVYMLNNEKLWVKL